MQTKFYSEKTKRKKPIGWPTCKRQDNIKVDLRRNRVWECGLDSSGSRQGPFSSCCEHGNEPSDLKKTGNSLTCWVTISFLRMTLVHQVRLMYVHTYHVLSQQDGSVLWTQPSVHSRQAQVWTQIVCTSHTYGTTDMWGTAVHLNQNGCHPKGRDSD